MNSLALRTTSWLFKIASIGSVVLFGLTGCSGGSSQSEGVSGTWTNIDTSYGKQGQATFSRNVQYGGVGPSVLQADGKLVIAGWRETRLLPAYNSSDVYVLRLNGDGSPDSTFGVGGEVRFNVMGSDTVADVKLQHDGKILLAVKAHGLCTIYVAPVSRGDPAPCLTSPGVPASAASALVRLTSQGVLDSTFGGTGIVEIVASWQGTPIAVQADGKILFLRSTRYLTYAPFGWLLARYNMDGTPDSTFNQGNPLPSQCESDGDAMAVQADGRIVVGGTTIWTSFSDPAANPGLCLERINADGSHDSSFRTAGLWTKFGANIQINSLSTLPNGGLLALGSYCDNNNCTGGGVVASRYGADGQLDTTFGDVGIVKLAFDNPFRQLDNYFRVTGYVLTPIGDLVILGYQTPNAALVQPLHQPT